MKVVDFTLFGQRFQAICAGPLLEFNDAISLMVLCDDQEELDRYWNSLLEGGGKPQACRWLIDRFGVRWQVVPAVFEEMMRDKDPARSKRRELLNELFQMSKAYPHSHNGVVPSLAPRGLIGCRPERPPMFTPAPLLDRTTYEIVNDSLERLAGLQPVRCVEQPLFLPLVEFRRCGDLTGGTRIACRDGADVDLRRDIHRERSLHGCCGGATVE